MCTEIEQYFVKAFRKPFKLEDITQNDKKIIAINVFLLTVKRNHLKVVLSKGNSLQSISLLYTCQASNLLSEVKIIKKNACQYDFLIYITCVG